jgi:hypothetical protein
VVRCYKRCPKFLDKHSSFGVFRLFMLKFKDLWSSNCVVWCEFEFGVNAHKSQLMFC